MDLEIEMRHQMLPASHSQHQEVSPERQLLKHFYQSSHHRKDGEPVLRFWGDVSHLGEGSAMHKDYFNSPSITCLFH